MASMPPIGGMTPGITLSVWSPILLCSDILHSKVMGLLFKKREVDEVIISAEVQSSKPHPDIFQLAANRLGIQPQEAIFIDDEPRFISGAQAVGMIGILFTDTAQTIAQVQAYLDQHA